jgi:hypothetical protein
MGKRRRRADLTVRPIPVPKGAEHPPPPVGGDILPQHEFTAGLIANKGSGKTTLIANLLDMYAGYFHNILVMSPTLNSDEKWEYVKEQPLLGENKALRRFLEKHNKDENAVVGKPSAVDTGPFDPRIPEDMFMTEYDESTLMRLMEEQLEMIETIKGLGGTKHLANRLLIVCDDMVGSCLFSTRRAALFKRLNTNHRHYSASIIMVSQAYKEIQRTVRNNFTVLITFENPNEAEIKAIYEEYPCSMKREPWERAYEYCTRDEFSFMYINIKKPKKRRMMKNFDEYITIEEDPEVQDPGRYKRLLRGDNGNNSGGKEEDADRKVKTAPRKRRRGGPETPKRSTEKGP